MPYRWLWRSLHTLLSFKLFLNFVLWSFLPLFFGAGGLPFMFMLADWLWLCCQFWNIHNLITWSSLISFQVDLNHLYWEILSTIVDSCFLEWFCVAHMLYGEKMMMSGMIFAGHTYYMGWKWWYFQCQFSIWPQRVRSFSLFMSAWDWSAHWADKIPLYGLCMHELGFFSERNIWIIDKLTCKWNAIKILALNLVAYCLLTGI